MPKIELENDSLVVTLTRDEVVRHGYSSNRPPDSLQIWSDGRWVLRYSFDSFDKQFVAAALTAPVLTSHESCDCPAPSTGKPAEKPESLKSQGEPTSATGKTSGRGRKKGHALKSAIKKYWENL